jgi:hypothetical protein
MARNNGLAQLLIIFDAAVDLSRYANQISRTSTASRLMDPADILESEHKNRHGAFFADIKRTNELWWMSHSKRARYFLAVFRHCIM